jgi:hypothetical protein
VSGIELKTIADNKIAIEGIKQRALLLDLVLMVSFRSEYAKQKHKQAWKLSNYLLELQNKKGKLYPVHVSFKADAQQVELHVAVVSWPRCHMAIFDWDELYSAAQYWGPITMTYFFSSRKHENWKIIWLPKNGKTPWYLVYTWSSTFNFEDLFWCILKKTATA